MVSQIDLMAYSMERGWALVVGISVTGFGVSCFVGRNVTGFGAGCAVGLSVTGFGVGRFVGSGVAGTATCNIKGETGAFVAG